MTEDIIVRATRDFITNSENSEEHLRLSFHVEEALQSVRESSRELVLQGVQECFSKENWKASRKPGHLTLWKESWFKCDTGDEQSGIRLEADMPKWWRGVYVCLYLSKATREKLKETGKFSVFKERECEGYGNNMNGGFPKWKYLKVDWRDWSQVNFLIDAICPDKRCEMVRDLCEQLKKMEGLGQEIAGAVEPT